MTTALAIQNCIKTYANGTEAVKGISLTVKQGDFFALLGPNGAGKSTLIGMIASLVQPTSGQVTIFGEDLTLNPWVAKQKLGVMPQEVNFNIFQNAIQILENNASLYGISAEAAKPTIELLLKKLHLWDKRYKAVRTLSGGYKRRLMLARALVHKPTLLLLDEPTAGVDVETRNATWEFVKEINQAGTTIILTTHYLEEAESLCNEVAIVNYGMLIQRTAMETLLQTLETESFILYLATPLKQLPELSSLVIEQTSDHTLEVTVSKMTPISAIITQLAKAGIVVSSIKNKKNRLEALFLALTQQQPS